MQWLSGRVLDSRPRGPRFEPHLRHCVVSLSKNINPSLVLVQHRKTRPFKTEILLMGRKESNQTNKDPDEMPFKEVFHLGLYCLLSLHLYFVVTILLTDRHGFDQLYVNALTYLAYLI